LWCLGIRRTPFPAIRLLTIEWKKSRLMNC
jgi:hypothetical protein